MKNERRHELQNNTLAAWLSKQASSMGAQTSWIIAGAIAIILALVFFKIVATQRESRLAVAQANLSTLQLEATRTSVARTPDEFQFNNSMGKLKMLAEEYQATKLGRLANLAIGDVYLRQGTILMRRDRQGANEAFEKAAKSYGALIEEPKAPEYLVNLARFRRARSYEWRNQLTDAIADYKATEGPYSEMAKNQLAVLSNPETKQWYNDLEFVDLTIKPVAPLEGFPDTKFSDPEKIAEEFGKPFGGEKEPGEGSTPVGPVAPADPIAPEGDVFDPSDATSSPQETETPADTEAEPAETDSPADAE